MVAEGLWGLVGVYFLDLRIIFRRSLVILV